MNIAIAHHAYLTELSGKHGKAGQLIECRGMARLSWAGWLAGWRAGWLAAPPFCYICTIRMQAFGEVLRDETLHVFCGREKERERERKGIRIRQRCHQEFY